jgi:hypothetical protein
LPVFHENCPILEVLVIKEKTPGGTGGSLAPMFFENPHQRPNENYNGW